MDSTTAGDFVEEREAFMALSSDSQATPKPHHFKPSFTSIDASKALLCPQTRSDSPPDLEALRLSVIFHGWRLANTNFKSWVRKMAYKHEPTWRKAGIFEAVMASTYRIHKDTDLVIGIAEKWCPETNTFVFPWGETTITLEDVMVLLGFSVLGSPVFATADSSEKKKKILRNLEKEWVRIKKDHGQFVTQTTWMERFMDSGDELEHEAFLVLWLSYFVFPSRYRRISKAILPIALHLSSGTRIALAPAVLARLYADLTLLKSHIKAKSQVKIDLSFLFKLVQVWTWERFKELQPIPNLILKGEPRLARWYDLKQHITSQVWQILDNSEIDSFEWRPYTKPLKNWDFPKFYPRKAMRVSVDHDLDDEFISYTRCIKVSKLVGIDCVEHYFPNRVALQFGMLQEVPCPVNKRNLSKEAAWNDYNKSIDDLTLYIPSRSTIPCLTPTFSDWWKKSFLALQSPWKENQVSESAETSRNTIVDDTSFVPSGSKMNRRSKDGTKIAEKSTKERHKYIEQVGEDDSVGQTQFPSDYSDEEDDGFTVGQVIKRRFKSDVDNIGGEASKRLGKRSKIEVDNNDSCPRSKAGKRTVMSLYDETISLDASVGSDGEDDIFVAQAETRQTCDDELHVYGSNADMINSGNKEPECWLHEDGSIEGDKGSSDEKEDEVSNIHGNQGHGFSIGLGSEENMKSKEQLEKRNDDFSEGEVGNDSNVKSLQEVKVLATSLEERIIKAEERVAWLKERRAIKPRKLAAARLI